MVSHTSPEQLGFDPARLARARTVLEDHVRTHTTPGAVALVLRRGGVAAHWAVGRHTYDATAPAVRPDDLYDLASVTKVVVTTTLCMVLEADGRLDLETPVSVQIPAFSGEGRDAVTVRRLLTHCGGLPAHRGFYETCRSKADTVAAVCRTPLTYQPGTETVYSDLGVILLGALVEHLGGGPLDELARRDVFDPLGMAESTYCPGEDLKLRIPPTEADKPWRGRLIHGEVHDENAAAMGGVAPHAGLFAPAGDLGRFLRCFLCGGQLEERQVFPEASVRRFTARANLVPGSTRALGWDTPSEKGSSAGRYFSSGAFGHTGFTGTSVWADPERDLGVILLTNRVHPTRENQDIRKLRPAFHDAVSEALV